MATQGLSSAGMEAAEAPMKPAQLPRDVLEEQALNALGYEQSYRRVLRTTATICMVISLTSCVAPFPAVLPLRM